TFTAAVLDPGTPRTVAFLHKERKLIGHVVLRGEKGPLVVRLQRWGVLAGRLVDGEGKPLAGVRLRLGCAPLPAPGLGPLEEEVRADQDGRFRVGGLVPGLKHRLTLTAAGKGVTLSAGPALEGLSAPAGEVRELGDVRVIVAPEK